MQYGYGEAPSHSEARSQESLMIAVGIHGPGAPAPGGLPFFGKEFCLQIILKVYFHSLFSDILKSTFGLAVLDVCHFSSTIQGRNEHALQSLKGTWSDSDFSRKKCTNKRWQSTCNISKFGKIYLHNPKFGVPCLQQGWSYLLKLRDGFNTVPVGRPFLRGKGKSTQLKKSFWIWGSTSCSAPTLAYRVLLLVFAPTLCVHQCPYITNLHN